MRTGGRQQVNYRNSVSLWSLCWSLGGASPAMGKVYFKMFQIVQHVAGIESLSEQNRQTITGFVKHRRAIAH